MAGYRNRMVHEYDVVTPPELYRILTDHRTEIDDVVMSIRDWLAQHSEKVDDRL
jgi:uncharacterized protein YutE (UPF0331/DUF86 family)